MDHDSGAALRRVAIVLSSLPETTVARLMLGLGEEQQRAVRTAMRQLADVDALERRRVLDAFAESVRRGRPPLASENDAAEIVLSRAARQHHEGPPPRERTAAATPAPLAFLSDVDDDALAAEIRQEHPQTIAIILASLAPTQAARILQRLDVTTRQETMHRLGKLEPPAAEVIQDIGSQLKNKLLAHGARFGAMLNGRPASGTTGQVGQDALRAILAAMPSVGGPPSPANGSAAAAPAPGHFETALAGDPFNAAPAGWQRAPRDAAASREATPALPGSRARQGGAEPSVAESAEAVHARLVALSAERLRQALASVETRQSLLALCGLPRATAEKVLASLPRRQARQVRRQLAELGTIELREIDRAKAVVAAAADRFAQAPYGQAAAPAVRQGSLMAA